MTQDDLADKIDARLKESLSTRNEIMRAVYLILVSYKAAPEVGILMGQELLLKGSVGIGMNEKDFDFFLEDSKRQFLELTKDDN